MRSRLLLASMALAGAAGLRVLTPAEFEKHQAPALPNGIPKVLHQTSKTTAVLPVHWPFVRSWNKCLDDSWVRVVWTDDPIDDYVARHAPPEFLPTYQKYVHPIQRVDAFRYVLLLTAGGIYSDMDNECVAPPEFDLSCGVLLAAQALDSEELAAEQTKQFAATQTELRANGMVPPVAKPGVSVGPVQNSLLASVPGHPFWRMMIKLAIQRGPDQNLLQRISGFQLVHYTTGVDLLGAAHYVWSQTNSPKEAKAVCELGWPDWHGCRACDTYPKYVKHHGTHVWDAKSRDEAHAFWLVSIAALPLLLLAYAVLARYTTLTRRCWGYLGWTERAKS